jgi:YVTN family beta-propeller protein
VVVNERTNRVYVSNTGGGDVWVYDAETLVRKAIISLGNPGTVQPGAMVVLPTMDMVAVIVRGINGVVLIQGTTLLQYAGSGGIGPFGLAADPVNSRLFVTNRDAGNMQVIYRTEFGQWRDDGQHFTFSDRRVPFGVAYNPANSKLYQLYVVNQDWFVDIWAMGADGRFLATGTVPVGGSGNSRDPTVGGMGLVVNPTTGNVFVANSADNTVSVLDGERDQVVATLSTGPDPTHLAVNRETGMVYATLRAVNRLARFMDRY